MSDWVNTGANILAGGLPYDDQDERLALEQKGIVIRRLLAGTTLTKAMLDDMMLAAQNGEMIRTYFDGETIKVERLDKSKTHNSGADTPEKARG